MPFPHINDRLDVLRSARGHDRLAVLLGRRIDAAYLRREHPCAVADPAALSRFLDELHQINPAAGM